VWYLDYLLPVIMRILAFFKLFHLILPLNIEECRWLMGPWCQPLCTWNLRFWDTCLFRSIPFSFTFLLISGLEWRWSCWLMGLRWQPRCIRNLRYLHFFIRDIWGILAFFRSLMFIITLRTRLADGSLLWASLYKKHVLSPIFFCYPLFLAT
jgi:hypothetical protein